MPPVPRVEMARKPIHLVFQIAAIVVFVTVQLIFGWDQAIEQGGTADHAIGIQMGGIIGGLGIAGLIALVTYFIARRSARAASIAFPIAIMVVSLGIFREWNSRAASRAAAVPHVESFADFTIELPAHWTRAKPVLAQTEALLVLKNGSKLVGVIQIDSGAANHPLTRADARAMEGTDGHLLSEALQIDGVEAFRAERPTTSAATPRLSVLVARGKKAYVIMGAQENGTDVAAAFDHILQTWRWNSGPTSATHP